MGVAILSDLPHPLMPFMSGAAPDMKPVVSKDSVEVDGLAPTALEGWRWRRLTQATSANLLRSTSPSGRESYNRIRWYAPPAAPKGRKK